MSHEIDLELCIDTKEGEFCFKVQVTYDYIPGERGSRDQWGGQLEPDFEESVEVTEIKRLEFDTEDFEEKPVVTDEQIENLVHAEHTETMLDAVHDECPY